MDTVRIGIIGIGNMGSAILKGLLHVYGKNDIIFTDVNREKCEEITKETGVAYAGSNAECANQAKYIILAVKPQYFDPVLKNIRNVVTEANVIISIAPGITIGQLKEKLGIEKRVVRGERYHSGYFYIIRRDVYCGRAADERGCLCQRKFTGLCIHVYRGSG